MVFVNTALGRLLALVCVFVVISVLVVFTSGNDPGHDFASHDDEAVEGLRLWRKHNCAACHSIYGLGGHIGPDLTNTVSRRGSGFVEHIIKHGSKGMASGKMPSFALPDREVAALGAYLAHPYTTWFCCLTDPRYF